MMRPQFRLKNAKIKVYVSFSRVLILAMSSNKIVGSKELVDYFNFKIEILESYKCKFRSISFFFSKSFMYDLNVRFRSPRRCHKRCSVLSDGLLLLNRRRACYSAMFTEIFPPVVLKLPPL